MFFAVRSVIRNLLKENAKERFTPLGAHLLLRQESGPGFR